MLVGERLRARGGGERERRRGGVTDGERFPGPGERDRERLALARRSGLRDGEREERVLKPGEGERRRGGWGGRSRSRSGLRPPRGRYLDGMKNQ